MFNTQSARNLVDEHLPPGTEPPSIMSSTVQFLRRNWAILNPALPAKASDALRFGLLGASNIAPMAVINPAKNHPEVIVAAVAARDEKKAQAYAKKHGIPIVHKSYQDLIDDPSIDVIYNALPNNLHFEWAVKALKAGKHVLLEKPSTSNANEAALLFHHDLLKQPNAPIILEAFHTRFHPAWQTFMSLLDPQNITSAHSSHTLFKGWFPNDDIRFKYDLSGGTLMDFGTYNILAVRDMMRAEPDECVQANPRLMPKGFDQDCDHAFKAQWRFPNGGIADIEADLAATGGYPLAFLTSRIPSMKIPKSSAVHKEVIVEDEELGPGQQHFMAQTVTFYNHLFPHAWHRIDIEKVHTIRDSADGKIVQKWTTKESKKAYAWPNKSQAGGGEDSWDTYRNMLEQFVNKVKGRKGSGVWMDGKESIKQMAMIDSAYTKAGMKLRPTSTYK